MTWLFDTFVWTGALLALVLFLRRPVARHFGARTAYALWLLPLLRMAMPPLVLPAPEVTPSLATAGEAELAMALAAANSAPTLQTANTAQADLWSVLEIGLVSVWLVGAALYIALRLTAYHRLRTELLAEGRSVGEAGAVRLVETPATRSPLAFGVVDKVVALPIGFMALSDRTARDLALAHELEHHRARDLTANFAMLPLFAIHWFNPLSWLGWRAMRRDQEAACDARVIAGRDRIERARYAALIAGAAAVPAPRVALAAPMACPVLGDKSIIHRLRNLTMTEHSVRRRRTGGAFIGLAALALPLTASITYAHSTGESDLDAPAAPLPPAAPAAPIAPLAPPPPEAPAAPSGHLAPPAPPAPLAEIDPNGADRRVVIIREGKGADDDGDHRRVILRSLGRPMVSPNSPEFAERMKEVEALLGDLDKRIESSVKFDEKRVKAIELRARRAAEAASLMERTLARDVPRVEMSCEDDGNTTETKSKDGHRIVRICRKAVMASALGGLKSARAAIAGNTQMNADTRREVLEDLDREIQRLESNPAG